MKRYLSVFTLLLTVLNSCKKSDSETTVSLDTYFPNTIGSNWTYKILTAGSSTSIATYTVSNRDTAANGRTYQVITGSNGTNQYYAKSGSDYYTFRGLSSTGIELNFLKEDKGVNETWNTSQLLTGLTGLPVNSITINTIYTIKTKGGTRVVNSVTYNDVIKVRADLSAAVPSIPFFGPLDFGYAEFYFAKNVGIVESNLQIANALAGVNVNELYTLQSYQIK